MPWGACPEDVHPNREIEVRGVEVHGLLNPGARNVVEDVLCQIPVGINDAHTVPLGDELKDQVFEEGRLPCAAFADDVEVLAEVLSGNPEGTFLSPLFPGSNGDERFLRHAQR